MKIRKTLYSWLTNRYTIHIRSVETFAEKKSYKFTYAKLIVLFSIQTVGIFVISYYVITGFLSTWFDPREQVLENKKKIINLSIRVDSLSKEIEQKDKFIVDLKKIFKDSREENQ